MLYFYHFYGVISQKIEEFQCSISSCSRRYEHHFIFSFIVSSEIGKKVPTPKFVTKIDYLNGSFQFV